MKRVNLFCGHFGSGKTNVAVNFAFHLKALGFETAIADLDIVNPYFRTKDSENQLKQAGITVISLPFANSSVDLPSLPSEAYSLVQDKTRYAVFDIGGDDRGALALGRYAPYILEENCFDCFYVVNFYRPLTRNAGEAYEVFREIELAGGIPFTGIINNSNLGEQTLPIAVDQTAEEAEKLSKLTGVPVAMTAAREDIAQELNCGNVFAMRLQEKYW